MPSGITKGNEMTDFTGMSSAELIDYYNTKADFLDRPKVKKFENKETAIRRCGQILAAVEGIQQATKPVTPQPVDAEGDLPEATAESDAHEDGGSNAVEPFEVEMPEPDASEVQTETAPATDGETKENDVKKPAKSAKKSGSKKTATTKKATSKKVAKTGKGHGPGEHGMVGKGTNRENLLALFEKNKGYQVSISAMMKAVYGEARKDLKGPIMMVMKGLLNVFKAQKKPWEIRKTRENKENYFGLYNKSDK
jgi:hypothetical protein